MTSVMGNVGHEFRILGLVSTGHFMSHYSQLILPPLFVLMAPYYGVGFAAMGFIMALLNISGAIAQIPVGFMVDRIGAKWILIVGLFTKTFALSAMAFVDSFWILPLLAIIAGLGHSVFHPTDYAIIMSTVHEKRIGRAFSIHTAAGNVGTLLAPLVATIFLSTAWGWKGAILSVAFIGCTSGIAILLQAGSLQDHVGRKKDKNKDQLSIVEGINLLIKPEMLILYLFFCITAMATVGLNTMIPATLYKVHGIDPASAATVLSFYAGGSLFGIIAGGWLADKFQKHNLLAALAFTIGASLTIIAGYFTLPYFCYLLFFFIVGLVLGLVRPARDMMVKNITPDGQAGKTFGFMSNGHFIGAALSPVLMGLILDAGYASSVFYLAAGLMLLSILTLLNPPKLRI